MSDVKACPFCGEEILKVAIKCKHCQSDLTTDAARASSVTQASEQPVVKVGEIKKHFYQSWIFWLLVVLFVLWIIVKTDTDTDTTSRRAENSITTPASVDAQRPQDQARFISVVAEAQSASRFAENDMQRGGIKASRDKSICSTLSSTSVNDWIGKIKKIDSNSDGKGVLEIEIARKISIKTWNNVISDIGDETLLEPGTPIFNAVAAMNTGQPVSFSGSFVKGKSAGCIQESSLSLRGKLEAPDFVFRFAKVDPLIASAQQPRAGASSPPPSPISAPSTSTREIAKLIAEWHELNSRCRGGPGDDSKTMKACEARDEVHKQLLQENWCHGRNHEAGYQMEWHKCATDSIGQEVSGLASDLASVVSKEATRLEPLATSAIRGIREGLKESTLETHKESTGSSDAARVDQESRGQPADISSIAMNQSKCGPRKEYKIPMQRIGKAPGYECRVTGEILASFDCNKASNTVEKKICGSEYLRVKDCFLKYAYFDALNEAKDSCAQDEIRKGQVAWILMRSQECTNAGVTQISCLDQAYAKRGRELIQSYKLKSDIFSTSSFTNAQ